MSGKKLGEILEARRKERELSLHALAELTRLSPSYLGRAERGERRPSAVVLRRLAKPLGFTEMELLKMAGYLSLDQVDERIARFKQAMKSEITTAMDNLLDKVDSL